MERLPPPVLTAAESGFQQPILHPPASLGTMPLESRPTMILADRLSVGNSTLLALDRLPAALSAMPRDCSAILSSSSMPPSQMGPTPRDSQGRRRLIRSTLAVTQ